MSQPIPRGSEGAVKKGGYTLTARQIQVLQLVAAGLEPAQISHQLGIRRDQVKAIKHRIKLNLGLKPGVHFAKALARAKQVGFVD